MDMSISAAQSDMRRAYYSGAAGILASALAWFVAAGVASYLSPQKGIWALLIGGMLIHPVGVLLDKLLGASGSHTPGNPLGMLAGSSTVWLILSLPIAYVVGLQQSAWFFQAMLLVIGGRYMVFATLFGMVLYWLLGIALAAAGMALAVFGASAPVSALVGASLEAGFAIVCMGQHRRWMREHAPAQPTAGSA